MSQYHRVSSLRCSLVIAFCIVLLGCTSSTPHKPAPVVSLDMTPTEQVSPFEQDIYIIQPGDTLFAIAWYSGNDYRDLATINNLTPPYTIRVGDKLRLTPARIARSAPSSVQSRPPAVVGSSTPSNKSGQTSPKSNQAVIDRPPEQAYGKSEKNVNDQQVSANTQVKNGGTSQQFKQKVEHWVWPAEGEIVGTFDKAESGNKGIDIRNKRGTPIVAAADGKVVYTGEALRGYGRLVIIKHTETFLSAYAHNDRILVGEQQWVKAGEKIGTMGSSGTDSVMLHFEVRYRGRSLDPQRYLPRQ